LQRTTVRPSTQFYLRFSLLMVRSPGFGSIRQHLFALFRLAFTAPPSNDLGLRCRITRWIVLQKARRHPEGLRLLVRTQFQVLFHSHSWVLLTFPSRYLFSIDHTIYLALGGGPPSFSQGFTCPDLLDKTNIRLAKLCVPGYHCLWPIFPNGSARNANL
jgi:hypothetical protein